MCIGGEPYLKKKKKLPQHDRTAQEFVAVEEINDKFLYTRHKIIFGYLTVRAMGDSLLSEGERERFFDRLTRELEKQRKIWSLLSVPRVLDTRELLSTLIGLKRKTDHPKRLELLEGEIDSIQAMARNGAREPMIILKLWEREGKGTEQALEQRLTDLCRDLSGLQGFEARRLDNQETALLCKIFSDLDSPHEEGDEDTRELPVLTGSSLPEMPVDLINEITPAGGLTIRNNSILWGNTICRVYGASGYPRQPNPGWATAFMNNTEAITCLTFDPANQNELADALSRSILRSDAEAMSSRNVRERKTQTRQARDGEKLLDDIDERQEVVGTMSLLTMPFASDEKEFEEVCKRTVAMFRSRRIRLKVMGQLQEQGFKTLSPYHVPDPVEEQAFARLMPLRTLAGGSPMCINSYQDPGGFYFAKTGAGNLVSLDFWFRGGDRTNTNLFVLGKAGMGKSTLIKHIMQMEFMRGTKIIAIDPESEYNEITRLLGGPILYAGGGDAKVNLLQVRVSPQDDAEEPDRLYDTGFVRQYKGSDLAMHLKNLDTKFRSYLPEASEIEFALLEKACIDLYSRHGITWDTDIRRLKNTDFPIMSDLYALLEQQQAETENGHLENLKGRLHSAAHGADQFIFNGHTNIDLNADIQCFDTNRLQNASDKIKRTQYLNLLEMSFERMTWDQKEKVMLVCDEGYLMVDENLPQSLMYLRNIEKRCRKFGGALAFITHSLVDILNPNIRQYGQALLDIPAYKFFMGTDGQNLKELARLYDLTEKQQEIVSRGKRGEALGMLGSTMLHLNIELPQYKLDNMGTAGGS